MKRPAIPGRVYWRCRRGLLELDLMLQAFLVHHYRALDPPMQAAFQRLLEIPDDTLLAYLNGALNPADRELMYIVNKIRQ